MATKEAHQETLFKAAAKVWCKDYEKEALPVFWGGEFRTLTDLETCVEPLPQWVWAVEPAGFLLNVEEVLASARDQNEHPVRDLISDADVEQLQYLLDTWSMGLDLKAYSPDYDRVVVLDRSLLGT
jgi:hypothetical protein